MPDPIRPVLFRHDTILTAEADGVTLRVGLSLLGNAALDAWETLADDLTAPEHESFSRKRTAEAKNSFCLGRIAARAAVAQVLPENAGPRFTVEHGIFGFPLLVPNPDGWSISLAHTGSAAAALCFPEAVPMGVDLEPVAPANSATMRLSFTERELQMRVPGIPVVLLDHLLWGAREALSKALRTGFLIPLSLLEVASVARTSDGYRMEFSQFSLFVAVAFETGGHLLVLVVPKKARLHSPAAAIPLHWDWV